MSAVPPETRQVAPPAPPRPKPKFRLGLVLVVGVVGAVALAYMRARVLDSVVVKGHSMVPTFADGTRLLAWHGRYKPGDLNYGEIVTLYDPIDGTLVIKRVTGLAGDVLAFKDQDVYRNGELLHEPYVNQDEPSLPTSGQVTVPPDAVFFMGDNRGNSQDSRDYGPVPVKDIRGRPFATIWPPSEWGRGQRGAR